MTCSGGNGRRHLLSCSEGVWSYRLTVVGRFRSCIVPTSAAAVAARPIVLKKVVGVARLVLVVAVNM